MGGFEFVLGDRYRLLSPLGQGGMASVFTASDDRLGRRIAVKVLADSLLGDPDFIKRFQQEAEAAAKLTHPNIVSVYDVGRDGDRHYIVMELVDGRNLKEIIEDRGQLKVDAIVTLAGQVLEGLAYAHEHGLIHRDIKPQNILVTKDGVPKLADFGIAKAVEDATSATQTAVVLGSAHYLSPEQASGERVSFTSDLYSMGVVLYEMSTGVVPFDGSNLLSVASRHIHDTPPTPSVLNPEVPVTLNRIIERALSKAPNERYQSAVEMRAALLEVPFSVSQAPADSSPTQVVGVRPQRKPRTEHDVARPAVMLYGFWACLVAIVALILNRGSWYLPPNLTTHLSTETFPIMSAVIGVVAVIILLYGVLERLRYRYTVDEHAVTVESGLFSHHRDAIPLAAIINLQLHQGPVARLFNIGTIVLTTVQIPGQGPITLRLHDVGHASEVYDLVLTSIGQGRRRFESPATRDEITL